MKTKLFMAIAVFIGFLGLTVQIADASQAQAFHPAIGAAL